MESTANSRTASYLDTFHLDIAKVLPTTNSTFNGRVVTLQRLTPYLLHFTRHPRSSAYINLIKDDLIAVSQIEAFKKLKIHTISNQTILARNYFNQFKATISQSGASFEYDILDDPNSLEPNSPVTVCADLFIKEIQGAIQEVQKKKKTLSRSDQEKLKHLEQDLLNFSEILEKQNGWQLFKPPLPTSIPSKSSNSYFDLSINDSSLITKQRFRLIEEVEDCLTGVKSRLIKTKLLKTSVHRHLTQIIDLYKQRSVDYAQNLSFEDVTRLLMETLSTNRRLEMIQHRQTPIGYQLQETDQAWAQEGEQIAKIFREYTLVSYQTALLQRNIVATFLAKRLEAKKTSLAEINRPVNTIRLLKKALPLIQIAKKTILEPVLKASQDSPKMDSDFDPIMTSWEQLANEWIDESFQVSSIQNDSSLLFISEVCLTFMRVELDTSWTEHLHQYAICCEQMFAQAPELAETICLLLVGIAVIDHSLACEFQSQITSIVGQPRAVQEENGSKSLRGMSKNQRKKKKRLKKTPETFLEALKVLPRLFKRENAPTFFKDAAMQLAALQQRLGSNSSPKNQLLEVLVNLVKQYEYGDAVFEQHKLALEKFEEATWPPQANEPTASASEMTKPPTKVDAGDDSTNSTHPEELELTPEQSKLDNEKEEPIAEDMSDDDTSLKYTGKLELTEEPSDSEEEEFDEFDMSPADEPVAKAGQPSSSSSSSKFSPIAFIKPKRNKKLWGQKKDKEKPTRKPAPKEKQGEEVQDRRLTKYTPFDVKGFRKKDDFISMALQNGYSFLRHGASHDIYSKGENRLPVPRHKKQEFRPGLLHTMVKKVHEQKKTNK